MEAITNGVPPPHMLSPTQALILADSLSEEQDLKTPKKRAETWVQEEIKALIYFRKEVDSMFNTTKSNKHLWEQISMKMRDRGYDRSPTMCIDKWRNLLKDYKKAKHHDKAGVNRVACYRDLEELFGERSRFTPQRTPSKLESMQVSPKGANRTSINLESRLHQGGQSMTFASGDATSLIPWTWRDTSMNGCNHPSSPRGRVIIVKYGELTRRIGIDGSSDAIKDAIKSAFGLRTKRAFWLEDEEGIVRSLDRDMPIGVYILNLDEGILLKICLYDESNQLTGATEEKNFYTEDDFRSFLAQRGWSGLREVGCFRSIECLDELQPLCVYQRA
ncbi:hypothetical protein O6H91_08G043400 [Diphasiastrum complanatum]|uniref:Uncharacterized protein n=2 Tax=Diphasiastrum complanatum TaxID=34168 RepID=A0ACC2CX16_DIPCM|nr:hypothetical protein O6H91_08G043400 [Diphasiastrum complanatum]KAJ7546538.1 hypothetical protein O6H91_08G043400 [Diphasiastrum complanatum]